VVAGDFDNDMDVDLYLSSVSSTVNLSNVYYENRGDGTFILKENSGGIPGFSGEVFLSEYNSGEKMAVADYDNNGFLDIFLTCGFFPTASNNHLLSSPILYRNLGNENNWIEIELQGTLSNRDAVGARVVVTAGGKNQLREQSGGMHSFAQNSQRLHFGLGKNQLVEEVTVCWPNGSVQKEKNIKANQIYRISEKK
jgi:hypothetical protein